MTHNGQLFYRSFINYRSRSLYAVFLWLFVSMGSVAQTQDNYFQQEVNYTIRVRLNDVRHELSGYEELHYINHSKDTLRFLYFHLWPNGYKNDSTALARQLLDNREARLHFAKPDELGYIDSLHFQLNGAVARWEYDPEHIDICKIHLNTPLNPGDSVVISTPFHVKIPSAKLSRLGHLDQAYCISQWYPKPAVYDREGWHPMPYLDQGEFYSEYGSFDVSITLPKNYVLAATGDRVDAAEEEAWLQEKATHTEQLIQRKELRSFDQPFPASDTVYKTIRFRQYRVHDFAWFADKRFFVLKGAVTLPASGHKVDTWAYFTGNEAALWKKSIQYINDATLFYSQMNGDYPYNHVSAVDGTISAGGGMEYPNITVIGESNDSLTLEVTIAHEVGHNWFYGLLGSNERQHPWMDEGINSFYELRYLRYKYPGLRLSTVLLGIDSTYRVFGLNQYKQKTEYELGYYLAAKKNTDQAIALPSEAFTDYNYGGMVYYKSALAFDYLMNYVGPARFDKAMQFYFEHWKFSHPSPTDLRKTLEYHLDADLSWFFDELLGTSHKIDYKILKHEKLEDGTHAVLVENKGGVHGPVAICGLYKGKIRGMVWYNGFEGKRALSFPEAEIDEFRIDYFEYSPDINRHNNVLRPQALFKRLPPVRFHFLGRFDVPYESPVYFMPVAGYNLYNQVMLGCAFYNTTVYPKKFEYSLIPVYAFHTQTPAGFGHLKYNILPNRIFQKITLGTRLKSYAYDYFEADHLNKKNVIQSKNTGMNYYKIEPYIDFELKNHSPRSHFNQHIGYRSVNLFVDQMKYVMRDSLNPSVPEKTNVYSYINELYYSLDNRRKINPYSVKMNIQHNPFFGKLSATLRYAITVSEKKFIDIRLFAGTFLYGSVSDKSPYRFRMSGINGYQDYMYDYNYLGRSETSGLAFVKFIEDDGAFKIWTPLGQSSKWMAAVNIKSPAIGKIPLKVYLDIGTTEYPEASLINQRVLYDAGFNITVVKDIFEIYIPLLYSKDIRDNLKLYEKTFWETLRVSINLRNVTLRTLDLGDFL